MKDGCSLIVPVYNGTQFIGRFMLGILEQTYQSFEVIFIDDGSTDQSAELLDAFTKRYNNIRVYHTANKGVCEARNLGMKVATYDWIIFADIDDYIGKDYLLHLMQEDERFDLVVSGLDMELSNGKIKTWAYPHKEYCKNMKTGLFQVELSKTFGGSYSHRFRKQIILENNLQFNSSMKISEDQLFVNEYLSLAATKAVVTIKDVDYVYKYNSESLTKKFYLCKNQFERKIVQSMFQTYENNDKYLTHAAGWIWMNCIGHYLKIIHSVVNNKESTCVVDENGQKITNDRKLIFKTIKKIKETCRMDTFKKVYPHMIFNERPGYKIYAVLATIHFEWIFILSSIAKAYKTIILQQIKKRQNST